MADPRRMIFVLNDDDEAARAGHEALVRAIINSDFAEQIEPVFEHCANGGAVFLRMMDREAAAPDMLLLDSGTYAGMDAVDLVQALDERRKLPPFAIISDAPYLAIGKFDREKNPRWCDKVFSKYGDLEELRNFILASITNQLKPVQKFYPICPAHYRFG